MTIKINGTELTLQPTSHGWIPKDRLGTGGAGHGFYAPVQEYELTWELVPLSDMYQIIDFFDTIGVTGTAVVELPKYKSTTYTFYPYSGCIINNPEVSSYFEQHETNVRLVVSNIRI